jgi:hypothetical protein
LRVANVNTVRPAIVSQISALDIMALGPQECAR